MAFLLDIGTVLTGCYFLFSILLLVLSRLIECRVHRANNVFREIKKQKYMVYIYMLLNAWYFIFEIIDVD
jgi:hypothetical protein